MAQRQRNILLPWEQRGVRGWLRNRRQRSARMTLAGVATLLVLIWHVAAQDEEIAYSRALLGEVARSVFLFRVDEQRCPNSFSELTRRSRTGRTYLRIEPKDAWEHTVHFECDDAVDGPIEVVSAGPSGDMFKGTNLSVTF